MIAVVDYGMGNLHSMAKAIEYVGGEPVVSSREEDLVTAERIVLPGVGAFGEAMENLRATGLLETLEHQVLVRRKPFLGVCLGMQLLARESHEHGQHSGLGWLAAVVLPLPAGGSARVPHTGWNEIDISQPAGSPLGAVPQAESFYFNHSYHLVPDSNDIAAAWCDHGEPFVAAVITDNILATQFHPEKSQRAGLNFLADFAEWQPADAMVSP